VGEDVNNRRTCLETTSEEGKNLIIGVEVENNNLLYPLKGWYALKNEGQPEAPTQ